MLATFRQPRNAVLLAVAVLIAIGCASAGVWQVHRYGWKRGINDVLRANDRAAVVPVGSLLSQRVVTGDALQFRRVSARGRYDAVGQLLVRQREVNGSPAYLVLTPLRTDSGPTLLVVRGWLASDGSATSVVHAPPPPAGMVDVVARLYPSESERSEAGVPTGQVDRIAVPSLAARLGSPTYGAYAELISQRPAGRGLSSFGAPDMSNPAGGAFELQHLAYVVQWFIFAIIALALPYVLIRIERRSGTGRERPTIAAPVSNHS